MSMNMNSPYSFGAGSPVQPQEQESQTAQPPQDPQQLQQLLGGQQQPQPPAPPSIQDAIDAIIGITIKSTQEPLNLDVQSKGYPSLRPSDQGVERS
jgi:hypothetical protein